MKAILALLLAGTTAPALAQSSANAAPAPPAVTSNCTPEHAALGQCKLPVPQQPAAKLETGPAVAPAPIASCTPEHAALGHCKLPDLAQPTAGPQSGRAVPAEQAPTLNSQAGSGPSPAPAAVTCTPEHATLGHCELDPSAQIEPVIPVAPPPPSARSGPENGADRFYDPTAMAAARQEIREHHGGLSAYKILIDQAEVKIRNGREGYGWDAQGWYGGDIDKLWIKSEGEGTFGEKLESAEVQALWSRAIDPWFDFQLGVRYDLRPNPERAYLVAGIQGLAPYWFEVDGSIFLSNKGDVSARFEGEYDLRITQRLILQPRVEFDLEAQDVPELGIGSGLSEAGIGARLRYEIFTESGPASIAPYVGIEHERSFGDTAGFRRTAGESAGGWNFVVGLRTWF